jgi:colicin import membrane protein
MRKGPPDPTGRLRTTSLGFYDFVDEGGLRCLGCREQFFHQGVAKESSDPEVVAATMSKPGDGVDDA